MPRNALTEYQKGFVFRYRTMGGVWLANRLDVDVAQIYQYAVTQKFSVKKNGRCQDKHEKAMMRMKTTVSRWPRYYRRYKKMLIKRDGLICHYCQKTLKEMDVQIDHVIPKIRNGSDAPTNLVISCSSCNHLKATLCYSCPDFRNSIK